MSKKSIQKIIVLLNKNRINILNESRRTRGEPARKDSPHVPGDLIHAHKKLSGGYEIAWDIEGNRKHPNKFPADNKIPHTAKAEIARLLKVDPNVLEAYQGYDVVEGEEVFIISEKKLANRVLEKVVLHLKKMNCV